MKRLTILFFAILSIVSLQARNWKVDEVPNVHVADRTRFLSNPEGIISQAAQTQIDTLLSRVRQATSSEVVAVVVSDIDEDSDINTFATELFTKWGLGKSDVDNGLLILVAKDARKAVIRPGYGMEGVMPDIVCGHILRDTMFPYFKNDDYDGGLIAGVTQVCTLLSDPDAAAELVSKMKDADVSTDIDGDVIFNMYLQLSIWIAVLALITFIVRCITLRNRTPFERYQNMEKWRLPAVVVTLLCLGMPLIVAIPLFATLYVWRNSRRVCHNCHAKMKKVDEVHDNDYLTPAQDMEERIGSVDYDVWLCPNCGETDIYPYKNKRSNYVECGHCQAITARLQCSRIVRRPTTASEGLQIDDYYCMNCGKVTSKPVVLPKKEEVVVVPIVGGGGRGFGGGGGSFGGGFGGGSTGGGGASGGW
jgi:uncharacterized protein